MKRNNKTALITGATGGIGLSIARELAKKGYRLALAYRSNKRAAERLAG
ncbi:MAG: YmfI, partial [Parcubacteria group bacterium GW2011_GWA1_54_9]